MLNRLNYFAVEKRYRKPINLQQSLLQIFLIKQRNPDVRCKKSCATNILNILKVIIIILIFHKGQNELTHTHTWKIIKRLLLLFLNQKTRRPTIVTLPQSCLRWNFLITQLNSKLSRTSRRKKTLNRLSKDSELEAV